MTNKKDSEKFLKCSCWGEGMLIVRFQGEDEFYFSYWKQGINPVKLSLWMRLKLCWLALFKGSYFEDEIILDKHTAREMVDWMDVEIKEVETIKMQRQRETLQRTTRPRTEVAPRLEMEQ